MGVEKGRRVWVPLKGFSVDASMDGREFKGGA